MGHRRLPGRVSAVLGCRLFFAAVGCGIAVAGALSMEADRAALYAATFFIIALSYFFWLDSPRSFGLPYLAVMIAFVYIDGLPVITLDYVAELLVLPLIVCLSRAGLLSPPRPLAPLIEASEGRGGFFVPIVDQAAKLATGALGFGVRYVTFANVLRYRGEPFIAIIVAEIAGYSCWWIVNATLPLPTADIIGAGRSTGLDSEGLDLALTSGLLLPPLVFLIYYGYYTHGIVGAVSWSVSTVGPHYLIKLMHQRRKLLIEHNASLREQSLRLERLNEALGRNQEDLRTFVYTVTHDLKNPVSAILLTTNMLLHREKDVLRPAAQRNLELIGRFAGETETMIRDLMQLFRITATPEGRGWVDLDVLVRQALESLKPQINATGICVQVGPLPSVWGEQTKLGHVISNLLGNAVKYVSPGVGRIDVRGELNDHTALITVQDNGIGISPAYHRVIFDIFTRVPPEEDWEDVSVVGGSGIGLAIVKRIVEAHGGAVWVESAPGAGSSFVVQLPVPR